MLVKKKITIFVIIALIFLAIVIIPLVYFLSTHEERTEQSLIKQFYIVRDTNPERAQLTLDTLLMYYPKNIIGLREKGYWYLNQGDTYHALLHYEKAHRLVPNDPVISLELAKLYIMIKKYDAAKPLLLSALQHITEDTDPAVKVQANEYLEKLAALSVPVENKPSTPPPSFAETQPAAIPSTAPAENKPSTPPSSLAETQPAAIPSAAPAENKPSTPPSSLAETQPAAIPSTAPAENKPSTPPPSLAETQPAAIPSTAPAENKPSTPLPSPAETKPAAIPSAPSNATGQANNEAILDGLMNQFYDLKKTNIPESWKLIQKIAHDHPNSLLVQKQAGHEANDQKNYSLAATYFKAAYDISKDPEMALDAGIAFSRTEQNDQAKTYLEIASKATDKNIASFAIASLNANPIVKAAAKELAKKEEAKTLDDLMSQFYDLKLTNNVQAWKLLQQIAAKYPHYLLAQQQAGYDAVEQKNYNLAASYFKAAYAISKDPQMALQAAYALSQIQQKHLAEHYFKIASMASDKQVASLAKLALAAGEAPLTNHLLKTYVAKTSKKTVPETTTSEAEQMLNQFYDLQKKNPEAAWKLVQKIADQYPRYLLAQKEAGYLALKHKDNKLSLKYFKNAYAVSLDPDMALQVGYIYNAMGDNPSAFIYFHYASLTTDEKKRLTAELAMTSLAGTQTKLLPKDYFFDYAFTPFYFSRFNLWVFPQVARVGKIISEPYDRRIYIKYTRTTDDKSSVSGQLSSIYDDDVAIDSVGVQTKFTPKIPLYFFAEIGKAKDLLYQHRPRWRTDFRAGLTYYQDWGDGLNYTLSPRFPMKPVGDMYGDLIYFTRYEDLILTARLRQGLRVFEFHSLKVDIYAKAFLVLDSQRIYYNNIFEVGPGIAVTPFNRYSMTARFEVLRGYYLPASSFPVNPYPPIYHNNNLEFDLYYSF